ncbi:MAG: hypothetical protein JKY37_04820 [Nannocystaceae bacterium]|nr:hypothetical protein [Nannocystaceae bacterium]
MLHPRRWWPLGVALWFGCSDDMSAAGTEAGTTAHGTSAALSTGDSAVVGSDETAGSGPCGVGHVCGSTAPEGWQGPIVRQFGQDDRDPTACPTPWPDASLAFFESYIPPGPTTCECDCSLDLAAHCYSGVWRHEDSAQCDSYSEFLSAEENACTPVTPTTGSLTVNVSGFGKLPCWPSLTVDMPTPQWGPLISACSGAITGESCGGSGGVCLPSAPQDFEAEMCVFKSGDEMCPSASPYSAKTLVFNGVVDESRACTACTCSEPQAVTCSGSVQAFASSDCSGDELVAVEQDTCSGPLDGVASLRVEIDTPARCERLTEATATGTVEPSGVFTYCCEEGA